MIESRPVALTMGEPSGIAAEITLRAWSALSGSGIVFYVLGSADWLLRASTLMRLDVPVRSISEPDEAAAVFADAVPVIDLPLPSTVAWGQPNPAHAAAVIASIELAATHVQQGKTAALVTNPIQKSALYQAGFRFPGHTEFLQELAGPHYQATMLLAGNGLRVVPVTIHQPLRSAIARLNSETIVATSIAAAEGLRRDFGIERPRLAIAGLNPHAGEGGSMGDEESRIIRPAIDALEAFGLSVRGPYSPDTMFTARARTQYDVAICMYHDQALIPLKTLDMDGVNVTLGLPFVRTSPDHGTALDIAGRGIADPGSLVAAIRLAREIVSQRQKDRER